MKPGAGKRKGGAFERDVCRWLSLWWTGGARDDVFWRTATSGGRATVRSQKGKQTHGGHGDVQAQDVIGRSLTSLCVIEMKTGMPSARWDSLLEAVRDQSNPWRAWISKSVASAKAAGTPFWLIIRRRLGCRVVVAMPFDLYSRFLDRGVVEFRSAAHLRVPMVVDGRQAYSYYFVVVLLDEFMARVSPSVIDKLSRMASTT